LSPSGRALLFCNGILENSDWLQDYIRPEDFRIAVNGGFELLKSLDKKPHLLVGDLDSIPGGGHSNAVDPGYEVLRFPAEKDQTDLELAIDAAVRRGFQSIRIIAALGGRLDQTLGNLFLLSSTTLSDLDVRIENGDLQVLLIRNSAVLKGKEGDTVSLIPIQEKAEGIVTRGLKFPLERETLYMQQTRGISNVLAGKLATIEITLGMLLCIHTRLD